MEIYQRKAHSSHSQVKLRIEFRRGRGGGGGVGDSTRRLSCYKPRIRDSTRRLACELISLHVCQLIR